MREDGKSKGQKEGSPGRNAKDSGRNSRLEVSWPNKDHGILSGRECWKIEEFYRKKITFNCGNIELCMKKILSAVGCGRMWKEKKRKWRGFKEEAKQAESKKLEERGGERKGKT